MTIPAPDSLPTSTTPAVPPGWYADPQAPGMERRWTGSEWAGKPHKPPRASLFGPDYARAYWFTANPVLRITQISALVSIAALVVAVLFGSSVTYAPRSAAAITWVVVSLVGTIAGFTAIVTAVLGLTRRVLGGFPAAVVMLVTNIPITLLNLLLLIVALIAATFTPVLPPR